MRLAVVIAGLLALPVPSTAAERLSGEAIRQAFEGNTVSGRYTYSGKYFTEFHVADGRALGHNGRIENTDACWITRANEICYYYGPPRDRRVHCFTVELNGRLYTLRNASNGQVNAFAAVEPGNPHAHTDNGKPWACDGLISQAPEQGAPTSRRLAAR